MNRRHQAHKITGMVERERSRLVIAEDPDSYRRQHGRCPNGYRFHPDPDDPKKGTCKQESEKEKGAKKEKSEAIDRLTETSKQAAEKGKKFDARIEKMQARLGEEDVSQDEKKKLGQQIKSMQKRKANLDNAHQKEIEKLRAEGVLPTQETLDLLLETDNPNELPDEIKNNPEKLKKLIKQQSEQRKLEEQGVQDATDYLEDYLHQKEQAEKRGEDFPPLDPLAIIDKFKAKSGRAIKDQDEIREALKGQLRGVMKQGVKLSGKKKSALHKWLQKALTIPPWPDMSLDNLRRAKSSVEDNMKTKKMAVLLDAVAETLEHRGAHSLATIVDAEASGYPEADVLPDGNKAQEWDQDWTNQTSDYGEDLGFPPYDKVRPKAKGDQAAN